MPIPAHRAAGAFWGSEGRVLAGLALLCAALWAATVPLGNFPLNDDWVYALAVRSILETGRYALPSPATANVFAQAYWGALFCLPFGFSFTALRVSTLVLAVIGVLGLYLLLRELGAGRRLAALGALTLLVNPLYLSLSTTFMTDVPFTSCVAASLWLYVRGARRDSTAALLGAIAIAFAAILIRQFALMLPLGFAVAHILRKGIGPRALAVAIVPILLGAALHVGYEHWVVSTGRTPNVFAPISSLRPKSFMLFALYSLRTAVLVLPYLGLFLTPVAFGFLGAGRMRLAGLRPALAWAAAAVLGIVLLLLLHGQTLPLIGNLLEPWGLGPLTARDTYELRRNLPAPPALLRPLWLVATVWSALVTGFVVVALASLLASALRSAWRDRSLSALWPEALLLTVSAAYAGGLFLIGFEAFWFDRYLIVLIPPLLGLLVRALGGAPVRIAPAAVMLALYAAFSVLATHDVFAWNRARWRALHALEAQGVPAQEIDGGYEYNGWRIYDPYYVRSPAKSWWWVVDDRYMIASGPLPGYREVQAFPFHRWLNPGTSDVFVLERTGS